MDDAVLRSMARWPDVPAVHGWLSLDRRGNYRLRLPGTARFEPIANAALREFIARNYASDPRGGWFFQNGPQRVYVKLAYTPLVVHYENEDRFADQRGMPYGPVEAQYVDEEGSVLLEAGGRIALLDDRDLARYASRQERVEALRPIRAAEVPARFGFDPDPRVPGYDPLGAQPGA